MSVPDFKALWTAHPERFRFYDGFDEHNQSLAIVLAKGDCLDEGGVTYELADHGLPARAGDRVVWEQIGAPEAPKLVKLLVHIDGVDWLAARDFAIRRNPAHHRAVARIVCEYSDPDMPCEPAPTALSREALERYANEPNIAVFARALNGREEIENAIRAHMEKHAPRAYSPLAVLA